MTQNKYISLKKLFVNNKRLKLIGKQVRLPHSQNKSISTNEDIDIQQSKTIDHGNRDKTAVTHRFETIDDPKQVLAKQISNTICKN